MTHLIADEVPAEDGSQASTLPMGPRYDPQTHTVRDLVERRTRSRSPRRSEP